MDNFDNLFEENCFLPCIGEVMAKPLHKDLDTLLSELKAIESSIEEIKARKIHLAELVKLHNEGLSL